MQKRCCDKGCTITRIGDEGYRVSYGFMLWACPVHAELWRRFDEELKKYEKKYEIDRARAFQEFSEKWYSDYEENEPRPIHPPMQHSVLPQNKERDD